MPISTSPPPLLTSLFIFLLLLTPSLSQPPPTPSSCFYRNNYVTHPYNVTMYRPKCVCPSTSSSRQHPLHPSVASCAVGCLRRNQRWNSPCTPASFDNDVISALRSCCSECGSTFRSIGVTSTTTTTTPPRKFEFSVPGCAQKSMAEQCRVRVRRNLLKFRLPIVTRQCKCSVAGSRSWTTYPADRSLFPCVSGCMEANGDGGECDRGKGADGNFSRATFRQCCTASCNGTVRNIALFVGANRRRVTRMGCRVRRNIQTPTPTPSPSPSPSTSISLTPLPPMVPCEMGLKTHDENTGAPILETECRCVNDTSSATGVATSSDIFPCMRSCMRAENDGMACMFRQEGQSALTAFRKCCFEECGGEIGTADVGADVDLNTLYINATFRQGCVLA